MLTWDMPTKPLCQQSSSHTTSWNPNVSSSFKPSLETKLYSFLTDVSTDAGNVEWNLVILLSCKKDDIAEEIKSYARRFKVTAPEKGRCKWTGEMPVTIFLTSSNSKHPQLSVLRAERNPVLVDGEHVGMSYQGAAL